MSEAGTQTIRSYALPGNAVFPESVGIDPATGSAFVGSLADGTIYRLTEGAVDVFAPAGQGGHTSVAGVKVDARRRLWAAGGYEGTLFVLSLDDGRALAHFDVGQRPSCVNDIAFGPDGTAYVTDSFVPTLFRVDVDLERLEPWVDLRAGGVPWPEGLNLNGLVLSPDSTGLVACQTNTGRFWRIDVAAAQVEEVALDGGPLEHCDGLAIDDASLFVAVNARNEIAVVSLAADGRSGRVERRVHRDDFAFPTAVAVHDTRVLIVNGQLDRMGGSPVLPFSVLELARSAL